MKKDLEKRIDELREELANGYLHLPPSFIEEMEEKLEHLQKLLSCFY